MPFERIRPAHIPQEKWEQAFAWPANNQPPYPPLTHRIFPGILFYGILILFAAVLLQAFTRFSVLTWLVELANIGSRPAIDCGEVLLGTGQSRPKRLREANARSQRLR